MTRSLTLLDFPPSPHEGWESMSPFVLKVVRALRFAKLAFEHVHLPLLSLPGKTPRGQLPVLKIGDEVLADSSAILLRIDTDLARGSLSAGLDARANAEAWLWEEFADATLYPFALAARWVDDDHWARYYPAMFGGVPALLRAGIATFVRRGTKRRLHEADFTRAGLADCYGRLERVLDGLEARAPASGFWVGDALSVADLSLFGQLHTIRADFSPACAAQIAERKTLSAYLDRVGAATL